MHCRIANEVRGSLATHISNLLPTYIHINQLLYFVDIHDSLNNDGQATGH
jgi:hypothetical protein